MMMSPPRPPSPPSGPPIGTNFSRRNDEAPDPPVPAFTLTTTRSMNIGRSLDPGPQHPVPGRVVRRHEHADRTEGVGDRGLRGAGVQCTMQVGVQLPVLSRCRTGGNDAELPARQIEAGTRQDLSVPFDDHPGIERRMQRADVLAQPLIKRAVHDGAGFLALFPPFVGAIESLALIECRRRPPRYAPPFAGGIERAWKPGKQVRLQDDLLYPFRARALVSAHQFRTNVGLAPRCYFSGQPDECPLFVTKRRQRNSGFVEFRHLTNAGTIVSTQR